MLYLAAFELIGVAACFLLDLADVLPWRMGSASTALFYTVWIVNGIFCGLLSYDACGRIGSPEGPGDWTSRQTAGRTGLLVVAIESVMVAAVWILLRLFLWHGDWGAGIFVPDNALLTLFFFVAILASVVIGHTSLRPTPKR